MNLPLSNYTPLLIVDDDPTTAALLEHYAVQNHFKPVISPTFKEAMALDWGDFSAVLLDLTLPDGDGFELLCKARKQHPDLPCFILTSHDKASTAVSALKAGAVDYFTKPFDQVLIFSSIRTALPRSEKTRPSEVPLSREWKSAGMIAAFDGMRLAIGNDFPVLLIGNPGTERRSFAQQIHGRSKRAKNIFAGVDAEGHDEASLELELFGTDSRQAGSNVRKRGKIETAHGGTLFIQDVDHLSLALQGRLIDALEKTPTLGDSRTSDFRLIASSRSNLSIPLQEKRFRNDLFYLLGANVIHLPSLRDVSDDIPVWCDRLLTEICLKQRARRPQFTKGALEAMVDYSWPGNLNQMRSLLEQIVLRSGPGLISEGDLPSEIIDHSAHTLAENVDLIGGARIDDLERISLIAALDACNGNRRRAAKRLGVSLRTIYNMIDRHALRHHPLKTSDL